MFGAVDPVTAYRQQRDARVTAAMPKSAPTQQAALRLPDQALPSRPVPNWVKWGAIGLGVGVIGLTAAFLLGGKGK